MGETVQLWSEVIPAGVNICLYRTDGSRNFQVLEDGMIELLCEEPRGRKYTLDRMCMKKVEKTPIILRGIFEQETWLSEKVALFNQKSRDYHVVLESCGYGNDIEDYARLTSVQIGEGVGHSVRQGSSAGLYQRSAGEGRSGRSELLHGGIQEDYFSLVFSMWRQGEKIYSVTPSNANSPNKEGAWEFIAFLLGEEVQYREELYVPPVHKESFDKWLEWELWWLSERRYEKGKLLTPAYYGENTSEEKREAYKKVIEDA